MIRPAVPWTMASIKVGALPESVNLDAPVAERSFSGGPSPASLNASERRVALDGWGDRVHAVAFEFETNNWPFQLNDLTVFYTGGVDLRGER